MDQGRSLRSLWSRQSGNGPVSPTSWAGRYESFTLIQPFRALLFTFACLLTVGAIEAQQADPPRQAAPQRPTFTNDTSVTTPGTFELEFGAAAMRNSWGLPSELKFTPDVQGALLRETEFSLGFDALTSMSESGRRLHQFGDQLTFAVRRALHRGEHFSFALAPRATFFLRGEKGARLGAKAIGAWSYGLNAVVANLTYTGATSASDNNSAHQTDIALGYSRTLGESGLPNRFSAFAEYQHEIPSGRTNTVSLIQGVAFRARPDLVLDFAVQQSNLGTGPVEVQFLGGLTVNLGGFGPR